MRREWLVYGSAALVVISILLLARTASWQPERELLFVRGSGWGALIALLLAISATPIGRLIDRLRKRAQSPATARVRRALGITAAALASTHATTAFLTYLRGELDDIWYLTWLKAGVLALFVLWALWLTSFPRVVRLLRIKLWKPLHRLAYLAVLLAFQHVFMSPLASRRWALAALVVTGAVFALRLLPRSVRRRSA